VPDSNLPEQENKTKPIAPKNALEFLSPASFIAAAKAADRNFRYAILVAGILGIVVTFAKFGVSFLTLVFGATVVLGLMVAYVLFAQVAKLAKSAMDIPAKVLVWTILLILISVLTGLTTSAFFNGPLPIRDWIVQRYGASIPLNDKKDSSAEQEFHRFLVGRWSAHQVVAQTGYKFNSVIEFAENGAYTENDYGNPPVAIAGSWKVAPLSSNTVSLTITLPVGTWTYTLRRLDQNSFKNEVIGYTAYRVSN
jgi:hypothetical protein